MAKRVTPEDEDSRIVERIYQESGKLDNEHEFNIAFSKLTDLSDPSLSSKQRSLRKRASDSYFRRHGIGTEKQRKTFKSAGGRSLVQDRKTTARRVVRTRKEFVKVGAKKSDLSGLDTKEGRKVPARNYPSTSRGRVVYSSRQNLIVRGKTIIIHRDSRGRFSSVRRK